MLSTAIGVQFDVNDLDANYEIIGSSDNYSFQYNLGRGSELVDFEGDTAQKTVSLKGNYGEFNIRIFAVSDIGIRSAFIEDKISISPPNFEDTFTFSDIRVSNLPTDAEVGSTIEIEPSLSGNLLAVDSEYVNKNVEIEWRLAPPVGHAKEGQSLGNELLSDKLLKDFSLQIRNTENGNIISSSALNSSLGLQQSLNTASVSDRMDSYTGFSFSISEDVFTELNLDRVLALEVVSNDAFGRSATGVLTGINYLPRIDSLSYNLRGAKMSLSWSYFDTDFSNVEVAYLGIPGEKDIYDPYSLQNSVDYYNSLSSAPSWESHTNYRIGDRVSDNGEVFECVQGYTYSSALNANTDQSAYWSGLGEPVDFYQGKDVVSDASNIEYNQIWGYNYYYSFQPSDGYGTGELQNLTETGLSPGGVLSPFKSDVKIDNLNFIEREDDLIFRWNITDQDNNLVDLNQYKFLIGNSDKPTILGISGSLFDSDTNKFLTGITDGLNSRSSVTENGQEIIVEDLPGTKVFETYEYTREINNQLYKVGGFPKYSNFSVSGKYNTGDYVVVNNEDLYSLVCEQSVPFTSPSYDSWDPGANYIFRTGDNYSDSVLYDGSIYCPTGLNHGDIVGPDSDDVLGIFNESVSYSIGDLVIAPTESVDIYKTGLFFDIGSQVLYQGSLYRAIQSQSTQDSIYPNTGINHWSTVGAFSNVNCFIYKATSNVPAGSEILPNTGFNYWQMQTPDVSNHYKLYATGYDFSILPWSAEENFSDSSLVIYANDIWSGVSDSGPDTSAGVKTPNSLNSSYWVNSLGGSHDFSTSNQIGDKVYSNGFVYKCLADNPTGAPILAVKGVESQINSSYENSQWIPYWELNQDFDDIIFGHEGIPESGKRSVGLELAILDPVGGILNSRSIIGNNPEPSILPQGFQVDSLSNVTKVRFNFNYAFGSREQTTKVQLYRSESPNFSILDSNGLPGSGASSFVSEILGPGDSTFGENITSITDAPPIPHISGLGDQITGYYYKILPFDAFGSGDLFNVTDNQGDLERVLVYPHGYNNQNKNGYMGPVFSTTEDAIPGPVVDFTGDTAFKNYFLNWKLPESQFDLSNNLVSTSPNDISHYEVWQSEDNHLYFGTRNTALSELDNLLGYRKITGDLTSVGPIPSEINDPASGITNATNVFNVSALSPSVQVIHRGEPNDKRYFWVRAVDHAGNKGPFTGKADLNLEPGNDVLGLDLILGQAKTTDIADFEQNITQAFPNNIALVPNNPFKNNYPSAGEISWDRHFLYHEGDGYVIGPGTASNLDQYVYWSSTGQTPTHDQNIVQLTSAQSGELGLGQIGGGSNLLSSDISNPLRNIKYSGGYDTSSYHPAGEGVQGLNQDSERPSLLGEIGDYIIARNSLGTATPMWHAFANALIGTAHIQEAAITNAKIHNLTADKIRSAQIFGQDIEVGGTGQIRSAGFGGLHSVDQFGKQQQGFAISGDGTFVFQTEVGKLFFEDDELTIHGNIRQKDGSELTVMNMTAEPDVFAYQERTDGVYVPQDSASISKIVSRFNNSEVTASDVRFRMEDPDGNPIFSYNNHTNGIYNTHGFSYNPASDFDLNTQTATASFRCGDKETSTVGFDTIIHGTDNIADFQSVVIFASGNGTSTEYSTTVSMLSDGAQGPTGRSPVYRGVWKDFETPGNSSTPPVNYFGIEDGANSAEELRGDVVYNSTDASYYIAIKDNTNKRPDSYPLIWKQFGAQFESVATNLLLADDAIITHSLTMGSSDSNNPAANGAGGQIISSSFIGGFNSQLTAHLGAAENYSTPGFRLQKSAFPVSNVYNVAIDVGGPNSYFRYSSINDKVEIKGSFINNTVSENILFSDLSATDSQATFIGGGYNNEIHDDPNNAYNSLASSIVGGAENDITGRFSFIGNGFGNKVADNFSAIVAGYNNTMPDININNAGANIIGAGVDNKIDGGSYQAVLAGDKNAIAYDANNLIDGSVIDYSFSIFNKNILGDGTNDAVPNPTSKWVTSNTWFSAAGLTYWDQGFYIGEFFQVGNKTSDKGWIYDANFGWIFVATSAGSNSTSLYDTMNTQTLSIWAFTDVFGNGEWVFFASSLIYTNSNFFIPSNVNTNVGTWQSGHGIQVYRNNLGSFWGLLRNSDGVIFYTETTNFDGNYVATPTIDDIDGDGVPNASDDTPAIRLRGIRQSSGSILWIVYVIFTKTSLTNANIYVSGSSQFSGSLSDTDILTAQNSYKIGDFSANNISTKINSYTNYAYFRFPVSSDNGSSYTDSQTIESIQVQIPTVGPNNGDEGSTYKYFYQNL
jgi:hypothetical protein